VTITVIAGEPRDELERVTVPPESDAPELDDRDSED
jgi:hypothetical protein